jgi:hypothetical protein
VLDFFVLPVTDEIMLTLKRLLSGPGVFTDNLIHVQLEQNGVLVLGAYDNFHRDCVVAYPPTSKEHGGVLWS